MSGIIPSHDAQGRKIGIMVCGHGSRDENAVNEFRQVSAQLKQRWDHIPVD